MVGVWSGAVERPEPDSGQRQKRDLSRGQDGTGLGLIQSQDRDWAVVWVIAGTGPGSEAGSVQGSGRDLILGQGKDGVMT